MFDSSGLITAPCGVPASGCHSRIFSSTPCPRYLRSTPALGRPRPSPLSAAAVARAESCRSSFSGLRLPPTSVLPSAAGRLDAAHPCSLARDGTHSSVPQSPVRRSVPWWPAMLSLPPDPAPSESPAAASLCSPASVSTLASPLPVGNFLPSACARDIQVLLQPLLVHRYRLVVHSCCSAVCLHLLKCSPQHSRRTHLIYQAEPFASFDPCFQGRQHSFRPDARFHPRPAGANFSGLLSFRHCRRCSSLLPVRHQSTFLRSLRSISITRLPRYYGRSDSCSPGSSGLGP